jgi:hypothetical protein
MKNRGTRNEDEAVSIQVGFVLNTGILTAFIAIVLVVVSGGFDDTSTEAELELVRDSIESKMIEADTLAETSGEFTAFFDPPESDLQYRAEIDSSGNLTLSVPNSVADVCTPKKPCSIDSLTKRDVMIKSGSEIQFSQIDRNVVVEYDEDGSGDLELSVQQNATRSG